MIGMNENGGVDASVWKWLAAFLAGAMLAGTPSYIVLLTKPSTTKVDVIEERQQLVLQRLSVIETRLIGHDQTNAAVISEIKELHDLLEELTAGK